MSQYLTNADLQKGLSEAGPEELAKAIMEEFTEEDVRKIVWILSREED
jgi:hypothetical protein